MRVSEVELHSVHRASSGTDNVPSLSSMPFESTVVDLHDGTYAVEICCFAVRAPTHLLVAVQSVDSTHSTRSVRSSLLIQQLRFLDCRSASFMQRSSTLALRCRMAACAALA